MQNVPNVRALWSPRAVLGEGPLFDTRADRVLWLDIKGRQLFCCDPHGNDRETYALPHRLCSLDVPPPGWAPPNTPGRHYLSCGDHGFGWVTLHGSTLTVSALAHPETHMPSNRFNDGKTGPDGRYWAGTMDDAEAEASGSLYAFSAEGTVARLDSGYQVTNGPAFAPGGKLVLHSDSAAQTVYAFTLNENGQLADKRVWRRYAPGEGYPDGMTIDGEGNVFIALWDGWRVDQLDLDGNLMSSISMPTARPTSCALSASEPGVLFVTSAAIGRPPEDTLAGSLFRVEL